jgi:two-component system phosphate regulon sensor histidine kinase PhoR
MAREAMTANAVLWSGSILAIVLAAWLTGRPLLVAVISVGIYAAWQMINVLRLRRWLQAPNQDAPRSFGSWARIFNQIETMQRKKRRSKKQYRMVSGDFESLTDAYPDATLVLDKNGRIDWFNSAASSLLGLKDEKHHGRQVQSAIPIPEFIEWLEADGQNRKRRLEIPAPFREDVWLEASSVPIRKKRKLIVLRDVTEVHHVERLRRDFVTNVSHELRTPLTVMLGYLEIFQDRPPDEMTEALQRMHAQAVQMQFMLDDFLELSRLQSVEAGEDEGIVDVAGMLAQLKEQAEEISRGDHDLTFEIKAGLMLHGVDSDLESAFRNLIVNALKYTPEGGQVYVRWHDTEQGPCLSVQDTGIGIPRREIPRLTERFYRVGSDRGRKSGGTGLGLAIVKHVLNVHQARLEIESEVSVGSTFRCIFPPERRAL